MHRNIAKVKGVGPAKAEEFEKLGIHTVADLLYTFPRRYIDRTVTEGAFIQEGFVATVFCNVEHKYVAHGRKSRLIVTVRTKQGQTLKLIWFSAVQYYNRVFESGQSLIVSGKVEYYGGLQIMHPEFEFLDEDDEKALLHVGRIVPLYASTDAMKKKGLDSRGIRKLVASALDDSKLSIPEILPESIQKKLGFSRADALRQIHFPEKQATLENAHRVLKYEELFLFCALMFKKAAIRKSVKRELWPLPFGKSKDYESLKKRLPFALTKSQESAIQTIVKGCSMDYPEAFLLQGDVGSGKTLVALSIALHYMENGVQVAVMAPTEILARQHYRTFLDTLGMQYSTELLTGSDAKKAKAETYQRIASGDTNIILGTHSLLDQGLKFKDLGLVIIDEQHRFGVEQRESLRSKGKNPDLIGMTATPIPRTLCLTEFGDLGLVTLTEKPVGRKPIKTMWLKEDRRSGMYKSIRNHVSNGRQAYIVYPVIEESEKLDLKAATDAFEELRIAIFPDFRVELLHGKMKQPDRDRIMREFRENRVQVLISTTVIEVGVDVPNATIMVIEHAERFGISQLHQLRGRVGRGTEESFCVLMSLNETEDANKRLKAVEESDDGFYLSEVDLSIRGPGELLGLKQHGLTGLKLADLVADKKLVEEAYQDASVAKNLSDAAIDFMRQRFPDGMLVFPT